MPPRSCVFVVPGSIHARTGGSVYDRRIVASLRDREWRVDVVELNGSFPNPSRAALDDASRELAAIADGTPVVVDGLAFGAMPEQAAAQAHRLRFLALVHLPLAEAPGLDAETAARFEAGERRALASAAGAIVTGSSARATVARYGVPLERIAVVEPGADPAPVARGSGDRTMHLVCMAAVTSGKGQECLIRALARLAPSAAGSGDAADNWRLTCAGSTERDPAAVARVRATIQELHVDDRVTLAGELDDDGVAALYDAADVFVLATLHETYGMAVAEALARGLPIVATTTGEIPRLVGAGEGAAGLLASPGNVDQLATALGAIVSNESLRRRCADNAKRARRRLKTWSDAGRAFASALEDLSTRVW